ncbi:MAG: hypothetical protein HY925_11925 [Elusimicrobia bacterium]|nr:hypothetical protein [Elusimicrobiota bacterium]
MADQLNEMAGDVASEGLLAACFKRKAFAQCQGACRASGRPDCEGGAWNVCMSGSKDEANCIRNCKGQPGCEVPPAVYKAKCSITTSVPPSYCFGL